MTTTPRLLTRGPVTVRDLPVLPALVVGEVHHTRHRPVAHAFRHTHYQWLIDLDAPPVLPRWLRPWAGFRGEDHLAGEPGLSALKANVRRVLEREGIATEPGDRVVMLAHARVLGHVFDPMSAFWCFTADGALRGIVVEVHNTYGGRHAYVVPAEEASRSRVAKGFYVSPFNDLHGDYDIRFHLAPDTVAVAIRLTREGEPLVTASVHGICRAATTRTVAAVVARHPLMTQRVSGLIRAHGIWLWARRLPVVRRPLSTGESVR